MTYAENGKLVTDFKQVLISDFLEETINSLSFNFDVENQQLLLVEIPSNCIIHTDANLLRRVIINMVKNAIEASAKNVIVQIGCRKEQDKISIYVKNKSFIPLDIQNGIFKRFFSTKAKSGRGLGTYSIKLITEQYLEGKAYFTSSEQEGTCFYVDLPIKNKCILF